MSANYEEDAGIVLLSINNLTFTMLLCPCSSGGSKTLPRSSLHKYTLNSLQQAMAAYGVEEIRSRKITTREKEKKEKVLRHKSFYHLSHIYLLHTEVTQPQSGLPPYCHRNLFSLCTIVLFVDFPSFKCCCFLDKRLKIKEVKVIHTCYVDQNLFNL